MSFPLTGATQGPQQSVLINKWLLHPLKGGHSQSHEQPLLIGSVSAFQIDPSSPNPPSASVKNTISFALRTVTMLLCKPPFPLPTLATVAMECVRLFRMCLCLAYRFQNASEYSVYRPWCRGPRRRPVSRQGGMLKKWLSQIFLVDFQIIFKEN